MSARDVGGKVSGAHRRGWVRFRGTGRPPLRGLRPNLFAASGSTGVRCPADHVVIDSIAIV